MTPSDQPEPSSQNENAPAATNRGPRPRWTPDQVTTLKRHVINLRDGRFIESGDFSTFPSDVQRIFTEHLPNALAAAQERGTPLRVLFWAHGGLVSESDSLQHVMDYHAGWLSVGVYPIYFVWETDHATSFKDIFLGTPKTAPSTSRGWATDITDAGLEFTLQTVGRPLWRQIKEYAAHAVDQPQGGAFFAAQQLASFMQSATGPVELYAMGHSAGSIFHSWFLPTAIAAGVRSFKELFLLAPAITVADFKARLLNYVGTGKGIDHASLFTMNETAERADNVITIYRKSLLYFVSRACEEGSEVPILGLQESVAKDAELRRLFGLEGPSAAGDVVWSPNGSTSNSTSHGGFDNDHATLHSMVQRITGTASTPFTAVAARSLASRGAGQALVGKKYALCVGIDQYAQQPLAGCVNDANQWRAALQALGFETQFLTDGQATHVGITNALRQLIAQSRPGDQLVFQYAGHGTQVDDVNGDEALATGGDRSDEALVPFDYQGGHFLIDDDLGEIFDAVPAGVSLTCFMDCCHSGSNTRAFGFGSSSTAQAGELSRYMHVPAAIMMKHVDLRKGQSIKAVRSAYEGKPEVLFAACSSQQTAKESGGHGYFTLTAVPLLQRGASTMTHQQFIDAVRANFPRTVADQDPQLDCSTDRTAALLLGAPPARRDAATTPAPVAATAATSAAPAPAGVDAQMLNETMHTFLKLIDRLA
jgi:Caspase domain